MRRVLAVLAAAALGLPGPAACAAPPARPLSGIGISPGQSVLWSDDATLHADLDAVAASGAGWLRLDVDWPTVEPEAGRRDWSAVDRVVDAARDRDLRVLGLLAYTPEWARPPGTTTHAPPLDPAAFAEFAGAAAARYRDTVDAWEVWNEPNLPDFWEPRPDPAAYAALLAPTAAAVRAADPGTTVLTGGLAPAHTDGDGGVAPGDFLAAVYPAGRSTPSRCTRTPTRPCPTTPAPAAGTASSGCRRCTPSWPTAATPPSPSGSRSSARRPGRARAPWTRSGRP
jgi:hypothetical protein